MGQRRPLQWIREATVDEIGEALLAVDPAKATAVAAYVAVRSGTELGKEIELGLERIARNPERAVGNAFAAGLGSLFGRRES